MSDVRDIRDRLLELEQACSALKASNQRRGWFLAFFATTLLVFGLLGANWANDAKRIEAESFILKDQRGKMRAIWVTNPQGSPSLVFLNAEGRSRLALERLTVALRMSRGT